MPRDQESCHVISLPDTIRRIVDTEPARLLIQQGFRAYARRRIRQLDRLDPIKTQQNQLRLLIQAAALTRFGRDHGFDTIKTVADYQANVPLRTYERLWNDYLAQGYPRFDGITWPGTIPYLALTSGTTQGATKYIPISAAMIASNRKAAQTMVAYHLASRPDSQLFRGKIFFLGGSTDLAEPMPGIREGDLSGIAAAEAGDWLRPFTFPPLELALETDWDRKLTLLAERSRFEPITMISGVPSWLLALFDRLLDLTGKTTMAEVWPRLEVVVHGGVKFDPYRSSFTEILGDPKISLQETYPCSEGFIAFGDPATDQLRLLFDHGIFYEFVPVAELDNDQPTRHWIGNVEVGINYAIVVSTCAGLWSHIVGDTVRFLATDPPLIAFTGRTRYTLSAFGEHLISEEVEAAIATASAATGAAVRDWHVGPCFSGTFGHHQFILEFLRIPADLHAFRLALDADLRRRNADYQAHRAEGVGLPLPAMTVTESGGFDSWMRSRGKLGGQHKVPRMDNSGTQTAEILARLEQDRSVVAHLPAGS